MRCWVNQLQSEQAITTQQRVLDRTMTTGSPGVDEHAALPPPWPGRSFFNTLRRSE